MTYIINTYNGTQLTTVSDGTIDNTTELSLVGKNYAGYGTIQNENFLYLLENFSNTNSPTRPITGQLWFDSASNKLKFYDNNLQWRVTNGADISSERPSYLTEGDFWYDRANKQLYVYSLTGSTSGTPGYVLVGPPQKDVLGTSFEFVNVYDVDGGSHDIIEAIVNGTTVFTISADLQQFQLEPTLNPISGFDYIHPGVTLCNTHDPVHPGKTSTIHRFWGTATNSDSLGGVDASIFVQQSGNSAIFADTGFNVGLPTAKLHVYNKPMTTDTAIWTTTGGIADKTLTLAASTGVAIGQFLWGVGIPTGTYIVSGSGTSWTVNTKLSIPYGTTISSYTMIPTIENIFNDTIIFNTTSNGLKTPMKLVATDILPGATLTSNIGSTDFKYNNIYAGYVYSTADKADNLRVGTGNGATYHGADTAATVNSIAARDAEGNLTANIFNGTATQARYADLAEKYLTDQAYEAGTVVMIGGDKEVTACQMGFRAIGVVSTNPAFMMNMDLVGGTYIALKGRVPVKVIGKINKGDRLVAGPNGAAQYSESTQNMFGIALESSVDTGVKIIEAIIL
jgi:hypothetical protein